LLVVVIIIIIIIIMGRSENKRKLIRIPRND